MTSHQPLLAVKYSEGVASISMLFSYWLGQVAQEISNGEGGGALLNPFNPGVPSNLLLTGDMEN